MDTNDDIIEETIEITPVKRIKKNKTKKQTDTLLKCKDLMS